MSATIREQIQEITEPKERIVAALDYDDWPTAAQEMRKFGLSVGWGKVNSLADIGGPDHASYMIRSHGMKPMVDYKLHDIDETMRRRARNITLGGAAIITVHALADANGMAAAVKGIDEALEVNPSLARPALLAVTVLTSHQETRCELLFDAGRQAKVKQLSHIAMDVGLDGLVCAAAEAANLRNDSITKGAVIVVPAIRPEYATLVDEQFESRATPRQAREAGADLVVVGRPITQAGLYGLTTLDAIDFIAKDLAV